MAKIAFLCTGNVCRSPMAQYLFQAMAPREWGIEVMSFGVMTTDGQEASANATIAGLEEGVDMSPHRSRAIRADELRECDLVFTMSQSHKKHLECAVPDIMDRIFCLTEFGRKSKRKIRDIDDPIGGDLSVYKKSFNRIREEIERIIPVIGDYLGLH